MATSSQTQMGPLFPLRPVTTGERWGAALAYLGVGALAGLLWGRGSFVLRHARLAFSLHLARLLISGFGLGAWYFLHSGQALLSPNDLLAWFWHLVGLFLFGIPLTPFGGSALGAWLVPAGIIWMVDLIGFALALQGRALAWDEVEAPMVPSAAERAEKERLRQLRDRRLEQIRYATTTAASERLRDRRIRESKQELGANLVRLDHLNHLLAIGELSAARYQELAAEVLSEVEALKDELTALGARLPSRLGERPASGSRLAGLGRRLQARTLSLSFVDHGGVPLFTFGHFPLDEALVAGMLSAFNSLSREIFGSDVHKTELAEGQVLFFVHGQWCVLIAQFDVEPSPAQIARLQTSLAAFEQRNAAELQRNPIEPARLVVTGIDFQTDETVSSAERSGASSGESVR